MNLLFKPYFSIKTSMAAFCRHLFICFIAACYFFSFEARADLEQELIHLQKAYPDFIQSVSKKAIVWKDGTIMPLKKLNDTQKQSEESRLNDPSLFDQIHNVHYVPGIPKNPSKFNPSNDPGRIRYLPFFEKMYGASEKAVKAKLVVVYWMPHVFGYRYPLQVTTVNHVDKKIMGISRDLEKLVASHPSYLPFLADPGGAFCWRKVAHTDYLSPHSFGIAIDVNPERTNYWQTDLEKEKVLRYRNDLPWKIVPIFERYGFIWGGKWKHYDTMHFEYRPELLPLTPKRNTARC